MSDRFDALMVALSAELDSIPTAEGDDMIRMSPVERGNALEVLSDRLAARCVDLKARADTLNMTLAMIEQGELIQGRRAGIWACPRCGVTSTMRHAIHHTDDCPFSVISDTSEPAS